MMESMTFFLGEDGDRMTQDAVAPPRMEALSERHSRRQRARFLPTLRALSPGVAGKFNGATAVLLSALSRFALPSSKPVRRADDHMRCRSGNCAKAIRSASS
jgi:hypothetical protein